MKTKSTISATILAGAMLMLPINVASAQTGGAGAPSLHQQHMKAAETGAAMPYAGQQTRAIKSLSAQDVDDLNNGRGWGLAKAAELNGVPGPTHLLEMKDKIGLSGEQTATIEKLFAEMKNAAVPLGKRLIELERSLNAAFAANNLDEKRLRVMLGEIGKVRTELRFVHLATHLKTPPVLTAHQIKTYNRLRGYDGAAPV